MSGEHRRAQEEALLWTWGGRPDVFVLDDPLIAEEAVYVMREPIPKAAALIEPKRRKTHPTSPRESMRRRK